MTEIQHKAINHLLYEENVAEVIKELVNVKDTDILYVYMFNYNWDNGFEIPNIIINHPSCDLSTALIMFYHADGDVFLGNKKTNEKLKICSEFIQLLYSLIIDGKYKRTDIKFSPPLSKVQVFKLKKIIDSNEKIFIEDFGDRDLNINI